MPEATEQKLKSVQQKRLATMSRLSHKPGDSYDVRKHRRGAYVSLKWMRDERLCLYMMPKLMRMPSYFNHRRFAPLRSA